MNNTITKKIFILIALFAIATSCGDDDDPAPTPTPDPDPEPPTVPTGLATSDVTDEGFTISWSAVTGADTYAYDVASDNAFGTIANSGTGISGTTAAVTGLSSETEYFVRVNATNADGTSDFSSAVSVTTLAPPPPPGPDAAWLASSIDALTDVDLGGFAQPSFYDIEGVFSPGAYNGQIRRLAQLKEIVDSSRNEPIAWDIRTAMENVNRDQFASPDAQGNSDIRGKIDELNFDGDIGPVDQSVADRFGEMADSLVMSSQANFTVVASNGVAGMITTGTTKRHVSAKGLEYIQLFEKGLYGAMAYDQMVDDYLRPSQSGADNPEGNNQSAQGDSYATEGTDRQHRFDEVFGYLGADPMTYPNPANTSNGDGIFIANYTFDFSDETEEVFGINLSRKLMDAFIFGRSVLKAGEGFGPGDETTNEEYYEAARADIKLYTEAGLAAASFHYLNDAIADITDEDKIHHLSEALAFIYALSFNSEGRISAQEVHDVLITLGWSSTDSSLAGVYDINLWEVTDAQMETARTLLDQAYPGFAAIPF